MLALDLDKAYSLRLLRWDTEIHKTQAKRIAYEVCKMAFGTKDQDDSILDASTLHPLAKDDPYADENTIIS